MHRNIVNRNIMSVFVVGTRGFFNPNLAVKGRDPLVSCQSALDEEALTNYLDWYLCRHR